MYNDNELIKCPECGELGIFAPALFDEIKFHHKIPSKLDGYFTFSLIHKIKNEKLRKVN